MALKAIAGPGDLSTAQIKPTSEGEWVECPACNGDGMVDAETYVNFDDKPLTVQFYGIGECFGNYQNLFDTAIKHAPAIALALIEKHRALEEAEAEIETLKSTHPKFATSSVDYWQRVGKGPADAVAIIQAIDEVIGNWMLDDDYHPGMIAIRNKMDEARALLARQGATA